MTTPDQARLCSKCGKNEPCDDGGKVLCPACRTLLNEQSATYWQRHVPAGQQVKAI